MKSAVIPAAEEPAPVRALVERVTAAPDLTVWARRTCEGILELLPSISVSVQEKNPAAGRAVTVIVPDPAPLAGTIGARASVTLPAPPEVCIDVVVHRGPEGFGSAERMLLALLSPYLSCAYCTVQARAGGGAGLFVDGGWAVVLLDAAGRVVRSTPGTVEALASYGLGAAAGAVFTTGPLARIGRIIETYRPSPGPARGSWPLGPARRSRPLGLAGPHGALEAVLVASPVGPHVLLLRRSRIAALLAGGLTVRQAQVALHLAAGLTTVEIADELGVAPATVKKHVESIFARWGVRHRAGVIARINTMR